VTDSPKLWAREVRATAALALPLIGGQMTSMGMGVADVLLAGHLSAHVLGTVAVATAVYNIANMAAVGVNAALAPSVAQLDGKGARYLIGPLFRQALVVAFVLGLALMAFVYSGAPRLALLLGFSPDLSADIGQFLRCISPAAPAVSLFYCCRGLSEGVSKPRPTMVIGLIGLMVLVPVGYVLMYAPFGNAPLGARGCAFATVAACWVQVAAFVLWLRFSGQYRGLGLRSGPPGLDWGAIRGLLRVGIPMSVSLLLETSLFSAAGLAIGRFGETAAASHQVALNVAAFSFMIPLGIAIATSVRVGNAAGRGDTAAVRRSGFVGMGLSVLAQAFSGGLMLAIPGLIAGIYTSEPAVIAGGVLLLRIAGVFQLSDGLQVSAMGALRGLKDTRVPMMITALAYWGIGFPLALILAFTLEWQAAGMWTGLIAGLTVAAALLTARFVTLSKHMVRSAADSRLRQPVFPPAEASGATLRLAGNDAEAEPAARRVIPPDAASAVLGFRARPRKQAGPATGRRASDRAASDRAASDRAASDRAASDRAASEDVQATNNESETN
jgi:MATE family multidrug resistance protein